MADRVTDQPALVLAGKPIIEYQPAVDLATGRILGFEALVRWDHPTRGHIPPEILIAWAESNDDIVALNAWVLEHACATAQTWPSGIQIAVNCSIVQLQRGAASKAVETALATSGLNPDRLTVEVTERAVADDAAAEDLRAVGDLGVHLAVDDVGTSWSSLETLRRFKVDIVKIDEAFVASLEPTEGMNRAIVDAIIHVSHSLNMSTVAEGVETAEQVITLREFGADVAQGFFFAPPLPEDGACALATAEPRPVLPAGLELLDRRLPDLSLVAPLSDIQPAGEQGASIQVHPARSPALTAVENPETEEEAEEEASAEPAGSARASRSSGRGQASGGAGRAGAGKTGAGKTGAGKTGAGRVRTTGSKTKPSRGSAASGAPPSAGAGARKAAVREADPDVAGAPG